MRSEILHTVGSPLILIPFALVCCTASRSCSSSVGPSLHWLVSLPASRLTYNRPGAERAIHRPNRGVSPAKLLRDRSQISQNLPLYLCCMLVSIFSYHCCRHCRHWLDGRNSLIVHLSPCRRLLGRELGRCCLLTSQMTFAPDFFLARLVTSQSVDLPFLIPGSSPIEEARSNPSMDGSRLNTNLRRDRDTDGRAGGKPTPELLQKRAGVGWRLTPKEETEQAEPRTRTLQPQASQREPRTQGSSLSSFGGLLCSALLTQSWATPPQPPCGATPGPTVL